MFRALTCPSSGGKIVCLLHYYPRHVSSINMPIFRRRNCIVCYTIILEMFRALTCPSSGGKIVCLLHYYPQHVLSINMPIFRRKTETETDCVHNFACKWRRNSKFNLWHCVVTVLNFHTRHSDDRVGNTPSCSGHSWF